VNLRRCHVADRRRRNRACGRYCSRAAAVNRLPAFRALAVPPPSAWRRVRRAWWWAFTCYPTALLGSGENFRPV